jgi:phosphatidate cytidylyltransferase
MIKERLKEQRKIPLKNKESNDVIHLNRPLKIVLQLVDFTQIYKTLQLFLSTVFGCRQQVLFGQNMDKNLQQRILTGVVAGAVVLALLAWSYTGLLIFSGLVAGLSLIELVGLSTRFERWQIALFTILVLVLVWYGLWFRVAELVSTARTLESVALALPWCLALATIFNPRATVEEVLKLAGSLVYVVLPLYLYAAVCMPRSGGQYQASLPIILLVLHWVADTAAYAGGRIWGRTPLLPQVSPKKTWEGFCTGLMGTVVVGFICEHFWPDETLHWVVVATMVATVGVLGDLFESSLKRQLNIKDSGGLLPGHGGILDRFDGFYFTSPLIYVYWQLVTHY